MSIPKEDIDRQVFSLRIKLMIGKGTVAGFARRVGLKQAAIDRYVKCVRSPNIEAVKAIALACNVSADWLMGLTDTSTRADPSQVSEPSGQASEAGRAAGAADGPDPGRYLELRSANDLVKEAASGNCLVCQKKDAEIAWLKAVVSEQSKALENQAAALARNR